MALYTSHTQLDEFGISFGYLKPNNCRVCPQQLEIPSWLRSAQIQFTTVTCLRLTLDPDSVAPGRSSWGESLVNFIDLFHELSCLGLHFSPQIEEKRFSYLCSNIQLPKLQKLELIGIKCAAIHLAYFLYCHRQTLEEILFENIIFNSKGHNWRCLIQHIRDNLNISSFHMSSFITSDGMLQPVDVTNRTLDSS